MIETETLSSHITSATPSGLPTWKEPPSSFKDDVSISVSSVHTGTSSRTGAMGGTKSQKPQHVSPELATKEQRRVTISKCIMILVLVMVAAGLCTATYLLLEEEEEEDYRTTFQSYASEIIAVSTEHVESTFVSIEALANSVTSYAAASGQIWPEVVIPDWTSRAIRTAELAAGARLVTMAPLVKADERLAFEGYASRVIHDQIQQDMDYLNIGMNATDVAGIVDRVSWVNFSSRVRAEEPDVGPFSSEFLVNWQRYPFEVAPGRVFVMNNMLRVPTIRGAVVAANITKSPKVAFLQAILGVESQVIQPIFREVLPPHRAIEREMVGVVWVVMGWGNYFVNLLAEGSNGIVLVLKSSCGFTATYEINGLSADFKGLFDGHDSKYDDMEISAPFFSFGEDQEGNPPEICIDQLSLRLYPSDILKDANTTNKPAIYTSIVAAIFLFTTLIFLIYDCAVHSRQKKVMARVITQDKLVSNLFPATIRDRLYGIGDRANGGSDGNSSSLGASQKEFGVDAMGEMENQAIYGSRPIADLFLDTTVLFADIAGFTAWSSAREPTQVFILLENIYGEFDKLCHRHGVFKVETIGDCYVAVTGLPEPKKDHAVIMAKFARDCITKMHALTAKLEIGLGPDTGDLDIRIGFHSGQVTAGVLRGDRSRFQLFGDTVNVAARMESSGERRKIQVSSSTAELLKSQGRSKWLKERGDILIHGKGTMKTYWLETKTESDERHDNTQKVHALERISKHDKSLDVDDTEGSDELWSEEDEDISQNGPEMSKKQRLVEWNVEILSGLLKRILAARNKKTRSLVKAEKQLTTGGTVLEEFEEIITRPKVTMSELQKRKDPDYIMLDEKVTGQLRNLLQDVSNMYRDNAFHSFEHASHVTASVAKLLSRIVTSDTTNQTHGPTDIEATDMAGHSYGITSDPLTQFAVVFSAIIHDVDHPGVPNAQLVKENASWTTKYKGKSLAEQHSVDLVWDLLMSEKYMDLRTCIYADEDELKRFRQLLVNVVMATDIADKELGALRKARWNKAFDPEVILSDTPDLAMNRKATIVLEHLIQASDVSHTMQHWQVYKKWNQRFFNECYGAWKEGRAEKDPSVGWYEGEIGFFDFYIIPLAKKLDSCGVFGVSSHEYLNYATTNRDEWKRKGQEVVRDFLSAYEELAGSL